MHTRNLYVHLLSFYTLIESFLSPWICIFRSMYNIFCWSGICGGSPVSRRARSSLDHL